MKPTSEKPGVRVAPEKQAHDFQHTTEKPGVRVNPPEVVKPAPPKKKGEAGHASLAALLLLALLLALGFSVLATTTTEVITNDMAQTYTCSFFNYTNGQIITYSPTNLAPAAKGLITTTLNPQGIAVVNTNNLRVKLAYFTALTNAPITNMTAFFAAGITVMSGYQMITNAPTRAIVISTNGVGTVSTNYLDGTPWP